MYTKNELFIFFNDTPLNNKPKDAEKIYGYQNHIGIDKKSETIMVKIDENGNTTRETLFKFIETNTLFYPIFSRQFSENEAFLYCEKGRDSRIVTVKIKE